MRLILSVISFLILPVFGFSQAKVKSEKALVPVQEMANSVLWEITGKGLKVPSYLFGTMHILCADDARLSDSLQYAIDKSDVVFFEVDMDNMSEIMGLFKYIRMKDNVKLSDLMTEEEYARVKKYFSENRTMLPLSMMERFKPYFIASMLSESKMPCETKNGMEEVIMQEVKRQQKPINGLESIAFQASVFDSIPYTDQAKELLRTIDSSGKEDSLTGKMLEVYRSQDLGAIEKLTQDEAGITSYINLFLYDRNAKWIPIIEAAILKSPTLIAVGAAHLPGSKGVIQLLRNAGYRLRPVKHAINQRLM
ncbi:TraB/GumN family protein [Flavihumibacter fluvii]|uniref:TraB/GumN family protein n=1 Tax=Flavihumibacter fluvii TaxID=2838157 RepID=UPI001BDF0C3A|nr:TraB/GumN family protein [Flavihumibacter fluvii]ULQ53996.1 TraB/GumN family protein [Flavihumibacter fluvii]